MPAAADDAVRRTAECAAAAGFATSDVDAVLVLGGGVPAGWAAPPGYVRARCDAAAEVYAAQVARGASPPKILMLSAGTAHLPQRLTPAGLPLFEATASAGYLLARRPLVAPSDILVETTSYDTISNAYFARTGFADVLGWRRVVVVTSDFHMERTRVIFDWVFGVPRGGVPRPAAGASASAAATGEEPAAGSRIGGVYELHYLRCPDVGLSPAAVAARAAHEARGTANVRDRLAPAHRTLRDVLNFLTTKHDLYTAEKLCEAARAEPGAGGPTTAADACSAELKDSYGGGGGGGSPVDYTQYTPWFIAAFPTIPGIHFAVPAVLAGCLAVAWVAERAPGRR